MNMLNNTKTLRINDIPFSIENLEMVLSKNLPGVYRIIWGNWEMLLKYNGKDFKDLLSK